MESTELNSSIYPFILNGVSLLGIDSVNRPVDIRLQVWNKIASDWEPDNLGTITAKLKSLELPDERMGLILQGKNKGRAIVNVS